MEKKLVPVDSCVSFWKGELASSGYLMPPSVPVIIKSTIAHLEAYQETIKDIDEQAKQCKKC